MIIQKKGLDTVQLPGRTVYIRFVKLSLDEKEGYNFVDENTPTEWARMTRKRQGKSLFKKSSQH